MNSVEHASFWASCSKCGHWGWDIYMAYATLRPQAYVCLFCAMGSDWPREEEKQANEREAILSTPSAPCDFDCCCD